MTVEEIRDRVEFAKDYHLRDRRDAKDKTSYWYRTGYIDACKDILRYLDSHLETKET